MLPLPNHQKHFTESVRTAARRLQIVFDTYGNVAAKTLNEETSAITNLIQELAGTYSEDTKTVRTHPSTGKRNEKE
ncbi:MAG: DUF6261 family protein [Bacteroidales bacterium]|nr:DUF6261 family protein [Bacteroidales bacterium]